MVPSWTETLVAAKVNVVGRTRYCIHPKDTVSTIPIVGGTKDWDLKKIQALQPDLIILDKEENPKFMAETSEVPWKATHIESLNDLPAHLTDLSDALAAPQLNEYADRWQNVIARKSQLENNFTNLPGLIEWGRKPSGPVDTILYVIWKDPWMVVSRNTFIGSVLAHLGLPIPKMSTKYPKINLDDFDPQKTLLLLSSEPYPFLEKKKDIENLPFPYAIVDGESFSWFGLRSLHFLEDQLR